MKRNQQRNEEATMTNERIKEICDRQYNSERSKRNRAALKVAGEISASNRRAARREAGCASGI